MNVFVSTWIKLPHVTHNKLLKIFQTNQVEEAFCKTLKRNQKVRRRNFNHYYDKDSNIEEVKTRSGQTKLLASDCRASGKDNQKVPCWHCREKEGFVENGMPLHIEETRGDENIPLNDIRRRGYFCDESCMYAFAEERSLPGLPNAMLYKKACLNASLLHKLNYPDKGCIRPAQRWELLKFNGGTLDYDVWKDETLSFQELPGFILTRVSVPYLQM